MNSSFNTFFCTQSVSQDIFNGRRLRRYVYIVVCILCATSSQASAEIHRYKDKNGNWHFTDDKAVIQREGAELVTFDSALNVTSSTANIRAPAVSVPKNICRADAARHPLIRHVPGGYLGKKADVDLTTSGPKKTPEFYVENNYFAPVILKLALTERRNITTSRALPLRIEVAPQSRVKVLDLRPSDPEAAWRYSYSYDFRIGKLNPQHDSNCYYLPPVPAGRTYRISQAFNGQFSHNNQHSQFAVDISMPIGTDVIAARGGIIIDRDTDYVLNGLSKKYRSKANAIRILHADGTIAVYAHLQFRSMKFYEGEVIQAGQVIGRSGNTGFSTGPHLHFAIHANQNMRINAIPFRFYLDGKPVVPKQGMRLYSEPVE